MSYHWRTSLRWTWHGWRYQYQGEPAWGLYNERVSLSSVCEMKCEKTRAYGSNVKWLMSYMGRMRRRTPNTTRPTFVDVRGVGLFSRLGSLLLVTRCGGSLLSGFLLVTGRCLTSWSLASGRGGFLLSSSFWRHFWWFWWVWDVKSRYWLKVVEVVYLSIWMRYTWVSRVVCVMLGMRERDGRKRKRIKCGWRGSLVFKPQPNKRAWSFLYESRVLLSF